MRYHLALRNFVRQNNGSVATEYALFLALVIGVATFGADVLGLAVRKAFAEASDGMHTSAHPAATVAVRAEAVAPVEETTQLQAANEAWVQQMQLAVIAVALVGGGIVWYMLYCRSDKPRPKVEAVERKSLVDDNANEAIFRKRQDILRTFEADLQKLLSSNVQVGNIMSRTLSTVGPDASSAEVRAVMERNHMRHVLVVDLGRRLLGVISDRDLMRKGATNAAELMTTRPFTVTPSTLLSPAITLLVKECISCLPVVQGDKLVGVFTTTDVLVTLQCALQSLQKASSEAAQAQGRPAPMPVQEIPEEMAV